MKRLAIVSDIHVGTGGDLRRDLAFVLPLGVHAKGADCWILNGDIGEPAEGHGMVSLQMALSELGRTVNCPKAAVLGNHDLAAPILSSRRSDVFAREEWPMLARKYGYTPLDSANLILPDDHGNIGVCGSLGPISRHQAPGCPAAGWDYMRIHLGRSGLERCQGQRSEPEERRLFDEFDRELLEGFRGRLQALERDTSVSAIVIAMHIPSYRPGEASSQGWLDAVADCKKVVVAVFGDSHQAQAPFHEAGIEWLPTRSAPHAPATLLVDVEPGTKRVAAWRWTLGKKTRPKRLPFKNGKCHDDF